MALSDDQLKRAFTIRLRAAFESWGGTQTELAKGVKRSQGSVSDWLTKGATPDGLAMLRLPGVLHVADAWLISGVGSPRREAPGPEALLYVEGGRAAVLEISQRLQEMDQRLQAQLAASTGGAAQARVPRDDRHAAAGRVGHSDALVAARKKKGRRRQA